jgi:hypothetical protein
MAQPVAPVSECPDRSTRIAPSLTPLLVGEDRAMAAVVRVDWRTENSHTR